MDLHVKSQRTLLSVIYLDGRCDPVEEDPEQEGNDRQGEEPRQGRGKGQVAAQEGQAGRRQGRQGQKELASNEFMIAE